MLDQQREMAKFFLCPLSQEIMFDPVLASDGKTYEREKIEEYIASKKGKTIVSPMNGKTEITVSLTSNDAMRSMIQQFLVMNPALKSELYFSESIKQDAEKAVNDHNEGKLKQLIEKEARLLETSFGGQDNLLLLVAKKGNLACLKLIVEKLKAANLFNLDQAAQQAFLSAAYQNKLIGAAGVKEIIQSVLSWEKEKVHEFLKSAITVGNTVLVEAFVKGNVVDHVDTVLDIQNNTALHLAASQNQATVVQFLIDLGANTKALNKQNEKPEQVASKKDHEQLAKDIVQWRHAKRLEPLKRQIEQLQTERENANKATNNLKAQEKLQTELEGINLQLQEIKKENELLKNQNSELREKLDKEMLQAAVQQKKIEPLVSKLDKLERENKELKTEIQQIRDGQEEKFSELKSLKKDLSSFQQGFFNTMKLEQERKNKRKEEARLVQEQEKLKKSQALQNTLIEAISEVNLVKVKEIYESGAVLTEPNNKGVYPLQAAVYSLNQDMLKYIEGKLEDKAIESWKKISIGDFEKTINEQMPQITPKGVNLEYTWIQDWYKKHKNCRWMSSYENQIYEIEHFPLDKLKRETWTRAAHTQSFYYQGIYRFQFDEPNSSWIIAVGGGLLPKTGRVQEGSTIENLLAPSRRTHDLVVNEIITYLNQFNQYVKSKITNVNTSALRR